MGKTKKKIEVMGLLSVLMLAGIGVILSQPLRLEEPQEVEDITQKEMQYFYDCLTQGKIEGSDEEHADRLLFQEKLLSQGYVTSGVRLSAGDSYGALIKFIERNGREYYAEVYIYDRKDTSRMCDFEIKEIGEEGSKVVGSMSDIFRVKENAIEMESYTSREVAKVRFTNEGRVIDGYVNFLYETMSLESKEDISDTRVVRYDEDKDSMNIIPRVEKLMEIYEEELANIFESSGIDTGVQKPNLEGITDNPKLRDLYECNQYGKILKVGKDYAVYAEGLRDAFEEIGYRYSFTNEYGRLKIYLKRNSKYRVYISFSEDIHTSWGEEPDDRFRMCHIRIEMNNGSEVSDDLYNEEIDYMFKNRIE